MNETLLTKRQNVITVFSALFAGLLVIASVLAVKVTGAGGVMMPAGFLAYSITFLITDLTSEVFGKAAAKRVVLGGFIALAFSTLMVFIANTLPWHEYLKEKPVVAGFANVMSQNYRIVLGSLVAFLVSQFHDVWAYHLLRKKTHGKHLWLRNTLSTSVSQLIDTTIFISIAFAGVFPKWYLMIPAQYVVKVAIAVLDTPFVYLGVFILRKQGIVPSDASEE